MTKSSVKVKYLPTVHPHFRDGLLKGNIHELPDGESSFHTSSYGYYESRPYASDEYGVSYDDIELEPNYWQDLSAAEFWSNYEIVYDRNAKKANEDGKETRVQTLNDNKGFIRKRSETAVLRYYLNYDNDEDLARGLLVLFHPFRNEMQEIHQHDVRALLKENYDAIQHKRMMFEKFKVMTDLIKKIQPDPANKPTDSSSEDEDSFKEIESTEVLDIEKFNNFAGECRYREKFSSECID